MLAPGVAVLWRAMRRSPDLEVVFLFNVSGRTVRYRMTPLAFAVLKMLDGTHSVASIAEGAAVPRGEVLDMLRVFGEASLLARGDRRRSSASSASRWSDRQINFFADFTGDYDVAWEMQQRLEASSTAIVGLGGIGTWVAYGLLLAGVNRLTVIDPDVVAETDLNRQCLYGAGHVGRPKATIFAREARRLRPSINVTAIRRRVESPDDLRVLPPDTSLVANCADDPDTDVMNQIVSEACIPRGIPHILCGGYDGHIGFIGPTILPGVSGCWQCYESAILRFRRRTRFSHLMVTEATANGGNLGAAAALIANHHVLDAIKLLTGYAPPHWVGRTGELDFVTMRMRTTTFERQPGCSLCGASDG